MQLQSDVSLAQGAVEGADACMLALGERGPSSRAEFLVHRREGGDDVGELIDNSVRLMTMLDGVHVCHGHGQNDVDREARELAGLKPRRCLSAVLGVMTDGLARDGVELVPQVDALVEEAKCLDHHVDVEGHLTDVREGCKKSAFCRKGLHCLELRALGLILCVR